MKKYIIRLDKDGQGKNYGDSFKNYVYNFLDGIRFGIDCAGRGEKFQLKNHFPASNIVIESNDERIIGCVKTYFSNFGVVLEDFE